MDQPNLRDDGGAGNAIPVGDRNSFQLGGYEIQRTSDISNILRLCWSGSDAWNLQALTGGNEYPKEVLEVRKDGKLLGCVSTKRIRLGGNKSRGRFFVITPERDEHLLTVMVSLGQALARSQSLRRPVILVARGDAKFKSLLKTLGYRYLYHGMWEGRLWKP